MPWPYKLFIAPIVVLSVLLFIIIICVILSGYKLTFRIPFSSFEIHPSTNVSSHRTHHQPVHTDSVQHRIQYH